MTLLTRQTHGRTLILESRQVSLEFSSSRRWRRGEGVASPGI